MLEDCPTLDACEERLEQRLEGAALLGDIPLSEGDLERLAGLIGGVVDGEPQRLRLIVRQAPSCLACLLVSEGIRGYRDGDYWSAVRTALRLPDDPNWESRWGRAFLDYLRAHDLPLFEIAGAYTYVTPILAHGGIPDCCLPEFFERVLLPLYRRLPGPTDPAVVGRELGYLREDDDLRESLVRERRALEDPMRTLRGKVSLARRAAAIYGELEELWVLEEVARGWEGAGRLPRDWAGYQEALARQRHSLGDELRRLWRECEEELADATRLAPHDERILSSREAICTAGQAAEQLQVMGRALQDLVRQESEVSSRISASAEAVLSEPWQLAHGEIVVSLPFERLREGLRALDALREESSHARHRAEVARTSPDDAGLQRLPHVAISALLCGAACVTWGARGGPAWPLLALGVTLLAASGWAGWSWRHRSLQKAGIAHAAAEAVERVDRAQASARAKVLALLQGLPLLDDHASTPSMPLHDALLELCARCTNLSRIAEGRRCLEEKVTEGRRKVAQVALDLGLEPLDTADATAGMLGRRLREAAGRMAEAAEAGRALEEQYRHRAARIEQAIAEVDGECHEVETELAAIGGGDPAAGERALAQVDAARERAQTMRATLTSRHSDLEQAERRARDARAKGGVSALERAIEADSSALASHKEEAERLDGEIANVAEVWPAIDEPIRRYLLHAGEHAERFLVGSLAMVRQAERGSLGVVEGVPDRVAEALQDWWLARQDRQLSPQERPTTAEPEAGGRFVPPSIVLDPGLAEIVVRVVPQRFLVPGGETSAELRVIGTEHNEQRAYRPRLYRLEGQLCQTQDLEFPLPFPAAGYTFDLVVGGQTVQRWTVGLFGQAAPPYAVFDGKSRRLREEAALERTLVWLVGPLEVAQPEGAILESAELYGPWHGHASYLLDLREVDQLTLVDTEGATHQLPVAPDSSSGAAISGGHILGGVTCEGHPVYVGAPPLVSVPAMSAEQLRSRRLSVIGTGPSSLSAPAHLRLSDLPDGVLKPQPELGCLQIDLGSDALLGTEPAGLFTVAIADSTRVRWSWTFCVVPVLDVAFEPPLILPWDGDSQRMVRALVACDARGRFIPHPPAVLEGTVGDMWSVLIEGDEHTLSGELLVSPQAGQRLRVPLTVDIPEVRWRLRGRGSDTPGEWQTGVCELWWGADSEYREADLFLQVPDSAGGAAVLSLDGEPAQQVAVSLRDGRARVPMAQFSDTLDAGAPLRTFSLVLPDAPTGVQTGPLFQARARWEAVNIGCQQSGEGNDIVLEVAWDELGRTGGRDRVIRLWSSETAQALVRVCSGIQEKRATLKASIDLLPPGAYRLEVALEDPWSTSAPTLPERGAPSTVEIDIVSTERVRQGQTLVIRGMIDAQQRDRLLRYRYTMRIIGRIIGGQVPAGVSGSRVLVTSDNEGWFVGEVDSDADSHSGFQLVDVNPVKFGYDEHAQRVFAIEDRGGDGAMYCATCRALFWAQDFLRREERLKHRLIGPVEAFSVE